MRVYLDNCCYNRPYDNHSQLTISLESQAKLLIQTLIQYDKLELVTSYILNYENSLNPYEMRRDTISDFIIRYTSVYVSSTNKEKVEAKAREIIKTGIHPADACHIACAITANCKYFLTTDKRLLKYKSDEIQILNPIDFIRAIGDDESGNEQ